MRSKIEKKIYKIVQDHNEDVDLDKMWSKLAPQLVKSKKKRPVMLYFFVSIVLGLITICFFPQKTNNKGINKPENVSNEKSIPKKDSDIGNFSNIRKAHKIDTSNAESTGIVNESLTKANSTFTIRNFNSKDAVIPKAESLQRGFSDNNYSDLETMRNKEFSEIAKIHTTSTAFENHISLQKNHLEGNKVSAITAVANSAKWSESIDENNNDVNADQENRSLIINTDLPIKEHKSVHYEDTLIASITTSSNQIKAEGIEENTIVLNMPVSSKQNNRQNLSFTAAYFFNLGQLKLKDVRFLNDYTTRTSREKPIDAMCVSLKYYKSLFQNTRIGFGLNMLKIWDRHTYSESSVELIKLNNVITERLVTPNGIEETLGSQTIIRTTTNHLNTSIQYQYWNLPIDLMYQIGKNKISIEIGAGLDLALHKSYKGKIYYANSNYDLAIDQSKILNKRLDIRLNAMIGIKYRWINSFEAVFRGKYVLPSKSVFNSSYGIAHYQNLLGFETGFNFFF
jgi:hypothetical protein